MKYKNFLAEGINPSGDGGDYFEKDLSEDEIIEKVNRLFDRYEQVNVVFNYPKGRTIKLYKQIDKSFFENIN